MKKALALSLAVLMMFTLFACSSTTDDGGATPTIDPTATAPVATDPVVVPPADDITYVGEVTVIVPKFDFEITLSDAASRFIAEADLGYGASVSLIAAPGSTVTFAADVQLYFQGVAGDSVTAGTAIDVDTINGYYVYNTSGSLYVLIMTPAYEYFGGSASLTADIADIDVANGAVVVPDDGGAVAPPANVGDVPPELAALFPIGTWPFVAGTYDPTFDTLSPAVPAGAVVYGLFDAAYATVAAPTAVEGYTNVATLADLVPGTYTVFDVSGFGYVGLIPAA
jgi:hypothetical protein